MLQAVKVQLDRLSTKRALINGQEDGGRDAKTIRFFVDILTRVLDAERCSIFIHDPAKRTLWIKAGTGVGEREISVPMEHSIVGRVIATGQPVVEGGLESRAGAHRSVDEETGFVTRNVVCVPILSIERNEVVGAVQVLNRRGGDFTAEDLAIAQQVAEQIRRSTDRYFLEQDVFGLVDDAVKLAGKAFFGAVGAAALAVVMMVITFTVVAVGPML